MRRLTGATVDWLRRLWAGSGETPPAHAGQATVQRTDVALGLTEALLADAIVHRPSAGSSAAIEATSHGDRAATNAFGRPLVEERGGSLADALTTATGMAMSGLRATAFADLTALAGARAALEDAVARLAPLVVHATPRPGPAGRQGLHAAAGTGAFVAAAGTGQRQVDLALIARWVAERALLPGVVAGPGLSLSPLARPSAELVRSYLDDPAAPLDAPTNAQRALFGPQRPHAMSWFDLDHPVATGGSRLPADAQRAQRGRAVFFEAHLAALIDAARAAFKEATGRDVPWVDELLLSHPDGDADTVFVCDATVAPTVEAAARYLRSQGVKAGVLALNWVRPFPASAVARALQGRRAVAVVEALGTPLGEDGPLMADVRAALSGASTAPAVFVSAVGAPVTPASLVALSAQLSAAKRTGQLRLDALHGHEPADFPRRDALVQSVAGSYPAALPSGEPGPELPSLCPPGGTSVGLLLGAAEVEPTTLDDLGNLTHALSGSDVRGTADSPTPGLWRARAHGGHGDAPDAGVEAPVDWLLLDWAAVTPECAPFDWPVRGGTVLVATELTPQEFWAALPGGWRQTIADRELVVLLAAGGLTGAMDGARARAKGEEVGLLEVRPGDLVGVGDVRSGLPAIATRVGQARPAHDSLPRFWGEVLEPTLSGQHLPALEPLTASGAVPAGASALSVQALQGGPLPTLDGDKCTACGKCWTACPDSALGVSALGIEAALTAASHKAGTSGKEADALRRAHKNLAGKLAGLLKKGEGAMVTPEALLESYQWLVGKLGVSDADRPAYDAAFEATGEALMGMAPVVSPALFREADKGQEALLFWSVDPAACTGCGLCAAACDEEAIALVDRTAQSARDAAETFGAWAALPDTAGPTIAQAAEHPEVGPMAAMLLSRAAAEAQVATPTGVPGSGERLAARLVAAAAEVHGQQHMAALVAKLDEARAHLETRLTKLLTGALSAVELDKVGLAAARVRGGKLDLGSLGAQLGELDASVRLDRVEVMRIGRVAEQLDALRERLVQGPDGLGRARFGVLVAGERVDAWATRFPGHPYYAPVVTSLDDRAVALARGLAQGLIAKHLGVMRALRRAELLVSPPKDLSAQLDAVAALRWQDLSDWERASCPPLLVLGDDGALVDRGLTWISRLLGADLPVKVVLLDSRGNLADAALEPALVAMGHRGAYVLAGSIAHGAQLGEGLEGALGYGGPALVHIYAPCPGRDGFPADGALAVASAAVAGRAHILLRYDPTAEGVLGSRLSLAGNPDEAAAGGFQAWAQSLGRFAPRFQGGAADALVTEAAAARAEIWTALRELAGIESPAVDRVRAEVTEALEAQHQQALAALEAEHAAALSAAKAEQDAVTVDKVAAGLLSLAGY